MATSATPESRETTDSPDTRTKLLNTAWRLIETHGAAAVTLADIAAAAGVSRQTIYLQFGSRAGLLIATARLRDDTSPVVREMSVTAREAHSKIEFDRFIRLWFEHVTVILPIARAIEAAAASDPDARAAWQERMDANRRVIRKIVGRLADAGHLAKRWTREEATEWFWSRIHINVWSQLVADRKWSPEKVVERVIDSLWHDLVDGNRAP
jgi:AcrR family transcriptional regulator